MREKIKYFPYSFREGQEDLLSFVKNAVKRTNVLVNAATGFGKTPLILAAILPSVVSEGRKIIWAVRTGTETDRPIEELKNICEKTKKEIFGLSFRGKKDMCLLFLDKVKERENATHEDVEYFCRKNKKECRYFERLESFSEEINFNRPLLYSELFEYCKQREICPYFFQSSLAPLADVLALSYNYVISEGLRWGLKRKINCQDAFLVLDEAHNLPKVASNFGSDRITLKGLKVCAEEIEHPALRNGKIKKEVKEMLERLTDFLLKESQGIEEDREFSPTQLISTLGGEMKFYELIEYARKLGNKIRKERLKEGKLPRSSLYHLSNFLKLLAEKVGEEGVAFLLTKEKDNLILEVWEMKSREILAPVWQEFHRCIFCSGTLNPIHAFAEVVGISNYEAKSFPSGFGEGSVAMVTRGLTTAGEELEPAMARKYLKAIGEFLELRANVAVFSASYRIQNALFAHGLRELAERKGRKLFVEREGMSGVEGRKILNGFKSAAESRDGLLCATMTGRFAEGADFPGKELEGIFLVGIPFDRMTTRTKVYLRYNEKIYGKKKGRFYAYIFPALRRASQALGRALRSKEDRAFFVLGDKRYGRFRGLLPDFIQRNCRICWPKELREKIKSWNQEIERLDEKTK